ncbi:MAG: RdgB/HAM1 family non-canonical purine NTP pyrophosphatase [Clostridia bacterium]|nr:RdgB/HAM1 family non-canonical purine NTP pyrophosphatase [Clostridia bacterium]
MMRFVLASNNKKKIAELKTILSSLMPDSEVLSLEDIGYTDDIEETGQTFEENSYIKASVPAKLGYIGVADDSGLCVDALGGVPGVRSARYSGKGEHENNEKLLSELEDVPDGKRSARFVCVMTAVFPEGGTIVARGESEGVILRERRGEEGFGYDPLFYSPELGKTFAEASPEEKNKVSHRGRALAAFCEKLGEFNKMTSLERQLTMMAPEARRRAVEQISDMMGMPEKKKTAKRSDKKAD